MREVSVTYICDNCGYSKKEGNSVMQKTEEELSNMPQIKVVGDKEAKLSSLPTTKIDCPKCGNN